MTVIKSSIEPGVKVYWNLYSNIKIQRWETKWVTMKMAYNVLYFSNNHLENLYKKEIQFIIEEEGRKEGGQGRREEERNQNPYSLIVGMLNGAAPLENSLAVLQ